jgi:S1-C subfamily serine protease
MSVVPCVIRESTTSGRATARAYWERAVAGLAIMLVTVAGCAGSGAAGSSPQSGSGGVGHAVEQDFTRVVHEPLPSIVEIVSPSGLGSGMIFDDKGDIVTNAHVVQGPGKVSRRARAG